jgi:hypothetical protein
MEKLKNSRILMNTKKLPNAVIPIKKEYDILGNGYRQADGDTVATTTITAPASTMKVGSIISPIVGHTDTSTGVSTTKYVLIILGIAAVIYYFKQKQHE